MDITFAQAGQKFIDELPTAPRRGSALKPSTLKLYRHHFERVRPIIGQIPLVDLNGSHIRLLLSQLKADDLRPATINGAYTVVKLICNYPKNEHGDLLFPKRFDLDFVGLPLIRQAEQDTPAATVEDIQRALEVPDQRVVLLVALAAASGLRVSELLALTLGDQPGQDCLDLEKGVIHVRKTLKTPSAARTVYLPISFIEWLRSQISQSEGRLFKFSKPMLYKLLGQHKLPPPHSYRRFYATWRRKQGMVEETLKHQMGHSKGSDITSRYSRATEDPEFIRQEVERCGLGFSLNGSGERNPRF